MSGVFLNEFLRRVDSLFSASDRLLNNTSRNTTDTLSDGFGALGHTGCRLAHCTAVARFA